MSRCRRVRTCIKRTTARGSTEGATANNRQPVVAVAVQSIIVWSRRGSGLKGNLFALFARLPAGSFFVRAHN